jgi:hypothetical protein
MTSSLPNFLFSSPGIHIHDFHEFLKPEYQVPVSDDPER